MDSFLYPLTILMTIFRRHHCRKCGSIVCQACSSKEVIIPESPYKEPVRVCDGCYLKMSADSSGSNGKLSPKKTVLKPPPVSPMRIAFNEEPENQSVPPAEPDCCACGCCSESDSRLPRPFVSSESTSCCFCF